MSDSVKIPPRELCPNQDEMPLPPCKLDHGDIPADPYADPRAPAILVDLRRCYGSAAMNDDPDWVTGILAYLLEDDDYWRAVSVGGDGSNGGTFGGDGSSGG